MSAAAKICFQVSLGAAPLFPAFSRLLFGSGKLDRNRSVIRRTPLQNTGLCTVDPANETAVQTKPKHVLGDKCRFARANIFEARKRRRANSVVVADHGGWTFERPNDAQQLPTVEQLAVRKVNISNSNVAESENLRETGWEAAWHSGNRQWQYLRWR